MKASCIEHPAKEPLIVVRKWQVEACDGNHCAAMLLSYFEYWHNNRLANIAFADHDDDVARMHGDTPSHRTRLLQWHTLEALEEGLLGFFKRDKISDAIKKVLVPKGFISVQGNPVDRYKFDRTRYYLFNAEAVSAYLSDRRKIDHRGSENRSWSSENRPSQSENRKCIQESNILRSGSEITTETTKDLEDSSSPRAASRAAADGPTHSADSTPCSTAEEMPVNKPNLGENEKRAESPVAQSLNREATTLAAGSQSVAIAKASAENAAIVERPDPPNMVLGAFARLRNLDMSRFRGGFARLAREHQMDIAAGTTVAQVEAFAQWWSQCDRRGKQGIPPTQEMIAQLWKTAMEWAEAAQADQTVALAGPRLVAPPIQIRAMQEEIHPDLSPRDKIALATGPVTFAEKRTAMINNAIARHREKRAAAEKETNTIDIACEEVKHG